MAGSRFVEPVGQLEELRRIIVAGRDQRVIEFAPRVLVEQECENGDCYDAPVATLVSLMALDGSEVLSALSNQ